MLPPRGHAVVFGWGRARCRSLSMLLLLLVPLMAALAAQGQSDETNLLRLAAYQKDSWQVEAGLPSNNIRMIVQQPDGRLLLATAGGLCTFDGRVFEPAEGVAHQLLGSEPTNAVLLDRAGALWIGTDGRGVFRQQGNTVTRFGGEQEQPRERVRMLFEDAEGALWIANQYGAERYWKGQLQSFRETGMIAGDLTMPFADDGAGGVLVVTSSGLFHWAAGSMHAVPLPAFDGKPTAVYRDGAGREWLGTTRGALRLQGNLDQWRPTGPLRPTLSPVTTMLSDRLGSLWIGTRRDGLYRESALGLEHFGTAEGLPDGGVKTLFLDDENDLWIGTLSGGLSRWREGAFAPYTRAEGFPGRYAATAFADRSGRLWLGTWDKGLFQLKDGRLRAMPLPGNPVESPIRALAEDRSGRVWVGTWFHGVYSFANGHFSSYLLGTESPANAVSAIVCDHQGGLWIGTYQGVLYYGKGEPDSHPQELLHSHLVTSMSEDTDGSLLVGTLQGLFRIARGRATPIPGAEDQHVLKVFVDRLGTAWAATLGAGLLQIEGERSVRPPRLESISLPPVYSAIDDAKGNLWLSTARGVLRVPLLQLHELFANQTKTLPMLLVTRQDGLRSSDCSGISQPSSTRMPDGTVWLATMGGFVHSTPLAQSLGTKPPRAAVLGWSLSGAPAAQNLSHASKALLPPGVQDLLVYFWAKHLTDATQVEFRYRLDGYDTGWTESRAHLARYRKLPPGHYRFEVQARIVSGPWSPHESTLQIVQQPFLMQTWLFRIAAALIGMTMLWFVLRLRLQRGVQREKGRMGIVLEERNRIAQECHDTLMAGFAAISWQLEATANLFRDSDAAATPAAKSCELARSMVLLCQAEARRIIYDLRETEEVTNSLSKALRRMLKENHQAERCVLHFDTHGEELSLPPGSVHHLTRIGQEAVRNALRHAQPQSIQIELDYGTEMLHLRIRDDGGGFQMDEAAQARSGHFGIAVMQERARKVGGTLRVQSDGGGTEVTVMVPFDALRPVREIKEEVIQWIGL